MRRAMLLLLALTCLCSCGPRQAPVIVTAPLVGCPAPPRPELPTLDPARPLDSPANIETIMFRDDIMRGYIRGLESCVDCYRRQVR